MGFITSGDGNSASVQLHYEDQRSGQPVVLIHRYPINSHSWERRKRELFASGYREMTYGRRGLGQSSKVGSGYDHDTFTADLNRILDALDPHDVVLVGFSMGTGEWARFVARRGHDREVKLAFLASRQPFLVSRVDNPDGFGQAVFDGVAAGKANTYSGFTRCYNDVCNQDENLGSRTSQEVVTGSWNAAITSAPIAGHAVVQSWTEDFRADIEAVCASGLPAPILEGTQANVLPIDATGRRFHAAFPEADYVEVDAAPTACCGRTPTRSMTRCQRSSSTRYMPSARDLEPRILSCHMWWEQCSTGLSLTNSRRSVSAGRT